MGSSAQHIELRPLNRINSATRRGYGAIRIPTRKDRWLNSAYSLRRMRTPAPPQGKNKLSKEPRGQAPRHIWRDRRRPVRRILRTTRRSSLQQQRCSRLRGRAPKSNEFKIVPVAGGVEFLGRLEHRLSAGGGPGIVEGKERLKFADDLPCCSFRNQVAFDLELEALLEERGSVDPHLPENPRLSLACRRSVKGGMVAASCASKGC